MRAAGLIFSNIHDSGIPELTGVRTMASVPFGCRYRLIDFALSNLVNGGIDKVGIITHTNYRSLLEHIGSGADWDLERSGGGVRILPPFITAYENGSAPQVYSSRLEALMGGMNYIKNCGEEFMVMSDCDVICNIDIAGLLRAHEAAGADISVVTKKLEPGRLPPSRALLLRAGAGGIIEEAAEYSGESGMWEDYEVSLNIMVTRRVYLEGLVADAMAHGYNNFYRDIICRRLRDADFRIHTFGGYHAFVGSLEGYFACSMELLDHRVREALFGVEGRPIMTKILNSPPTRYGEGGEARGTLAADGCVIEGCVESSILFRGVRIGRGAVVRNSVLFDGVSVGDGARLDSMVVDKGVSIGGELSLSGCAAAPLYIPKGKKI